MPRVRAGELAINYVEHGSGDNVVLAVHGNLGCADWLALVLPQLPPDVRVIAAEWRGCGESDKPLPAVDFSNYSMATHAQDMLNLLDALGIQRCHLYGHSTGGIICSYMLVKQPERFGKVLMLDPVTPLGLELAAGQIDVLTQMKNDPATCFAGMASAAPTLFRAETLAPGQQPQFALTASAAQRQLFERIIERTTVLSDGIWFGTPQNLAKEWTSGALAAQSSGDDARASRALRQARLLGAARALRRDGQAPAEVQPRSLSLHRPLDEPGGPQPVRGDLRPLLQTGLIDR
jgi:pimeloyl-ACP methyl ester carboxylesterase